MKTGTIGSLDRNWQASKLRPGIVLNEYHLGKASGGMTCRAVFRR